MVSVLHSAAVRFRDVPSLLDPSLNIPQKDSRYCQACKFRTKSDDAGSIREFRAMHPYLSRDLVSDVASDPGTVHDASIALGVIQVSHFLLSVTLSLLNIDNGVYGVLKLTKH